MHVLVLVGHNMAGKSAFLRYLNGHTFSESYMQTIGKDMLYKGDFIIHDMSGNERYHSICEEYYPYANAALVFYEVGREDTVQEWIDKFESIPVIIICNKIDTIQTYTAPNFKCPTPIYIKWFRNWCILWCGAAGCITSLPFCTKYWFVIDCLDRLIVTLIIFFYIDYSLFHNTLSMIFTSFIFSNYYSSNTWVVFII